MTDDAPIEDAQADQLIRTFAAVADATPLTDRRAELVAAVERPRSRARFLPIAAALLLVGAAVVTLALRTDDDTERAGPGAAAPVGPIDDPALATGWYLPSDDWAITEVSADDLGPGCACSVFAAARPGDQDPAVVIVHDWEAPDPGDEMPPSDPDPVDVGGREGWRDDDGLDGIDGSEVGSIGLRVTAGDRRIEAHGRGVAVPDLVAVADAWADAIEAGLTPDAAALPLPDGFVRTPVRSAVGPERTLLALSVEQEGTGARAEYQIIPAGYQRRLLLLAHEIEVSAAGTLLFVGDVRGELVAGAIGGPVDVTAGSSYVGRGPADLDRDALVAFRDALHEVDTAAWRAALPSGALADLIRRQPTLFDPPTGG